MKRIIASAGVLVAGTTAIQAQNTAYLEPGQAGKLLTVSMAVRGFYDDNYLTYPSSGLLSFRPAMTRIVGTNVIVTPATNVLIKPRGSFGFELNPSLKLNLPREQTFIQAGYDYSMKYFFDRENDPVDHTHQFSGLVDHQFTGRYKAVLNESFVYSQEPELLAGGGSVSNPIRTDTSAARNHVKMEVNGAITEVIGAAISYENVWYDYEDDGDFSYSALLDRLEHSFDLSGRWLVDEKTTASLGYRLGLANYTSESLISLGDNPSPTNTVDDVIGSDRGSITHNLYVALNRKYGERLNASARVGVDYTSYDYAQADSTLSPSIDAWGTYEYQPGSRLTAGVAHHRSATDAVGQGSDITTDQETTRAYVAVSHKVTPKLTGGLDISYQHGVFSGGVNDSSVDGYFSASLRFYYRMNNNWSTELSYNLYRLDSDLPDRSYTRNIIFAGVRATY